jgi:hypothetical protein
MRTSLDDRNGRNGCPGTASSPDALAFRKDKNLVVEVMRESPESSVKLKRIRSLLNGREGWELKIIWISPFGDRNVIGVQSKSAIQRRLNEARALLVAGHTEPALLFAWATFEAVARS